MLPRFAPLLSLIAFLVVSIAASNAAAQDRVQLAFAPNVGATTSYEIRKTKQRFEGDELERSLQTTSRARLTLMSRNDKGYVYRFTVTDTAAVVPRSGEPGLDKLLRRLSGVTVNIPLVYQADAAGLPLHLLNADEVRGAFKAILDELRQIVAKLGSRGVLSPDQQQMLASTVDGTFGVLTQLSDSELSSFVLEEALLLFAVTGGDYAVDAMEPFEIETVLPIVNRPISVPAARGIKQLDRRGGRAVIEIDVDYNQEVLLREVSRPSRNSAADLETSIRSLGDFTVTESQLFVVDLSSGQPLELRHQRVMAIGPRRELEDTRIRRLSQ